MTDPSTISEIPPTKLQVRPDLVTLIVANVMEIQEADPDYPDAEVLYHAVRATLTHELLRPETTGVAPSIFVYYIQCYRLLKVTRKQADPQDATLYTQGCLALFDLYRDEPENLTLRRLVVESITALHEVIVEIQDQRDGVSTEDALGLLSGIALVVYTFPRYIKSPARRIRNLPYVQWVRDYLEQAASNPDLGAVNTRTHLDAIVTQIKDQKSVIVV